MTQASLISRFILWLPQPGAALPAALAHFAKAEALHIVQAGPFWLAADTQGTAPWLDVPMGKRLAGRTVAGNDMEALCAAANAQMQLYTLIDWTGAALTLCGDPAGFKPVYRATFAGGTLVATRLTDILCIDPTLILPLDKIGLHSLFMLRGIYRDRTLHQNVKRLLAGTVLHWSVDGGLRDTRDRRIRYPQIDAQMSADALAATADASLQRATQARVQHAKTPLSIALSGGFDSRIVLAKARHMGLDVASYSFGRRWHEDVRLARRVADAAHARFNLLTLRSDETLRTLARRTALYEGCTDIMIGQTTLLDSEVFDDGAALLHGLCGDVTNGGFVERLPTEAYVNHDALARGFFAHFEKQNADALPLFGFAFDNQALLAELRSDLDDTQSPLQAGTLCWVENHYRRFAFALAWCLGQRLDVIAPLYDADYFNIWGAAPRALLEHRTGFKHWLAKNYPALARVPHTSAGIAIPNLNEQLRGFVGDLPRWSAQRLLGERRAQAMLNAIGRSPETYNFDNLLTKDLQRQARDVWDALVPKLSRLGLAALPGAWDVLDGKPLQRRILLTVAAYAAHLDTCLAKHKRQQG
jgi:hypothetical protein